MQSIHFGRFLGHGGIPNSSKETYDDLGTCGLWILVACGGWLQTLWDFFRNLGKPIHIINSKSTFIYSIYMFYTTSINSILSLQRGLLRFHSTLLWGSNSWLEHDRTPVLKWVVVHRWIWRCPTMREIQKPLVLRLKKIWSNNLDDLGYPYF